MWSKSIWSRIQIFKKFYTTTISRVFSPVYDTLKAISTSLETVGFSFYRSKNKIWTRPNVFGTGPTQFELVQNSFRPTDGQGKCEEKNEMQLQNNFDTIVCMGESKGGQIYKFCLDFHHFSKWHSGVYVEFSLLEMWWFDDFFLIWLAHMYSFFFCLQFYTTVKQSIMFCLILFFL